MPPSKSIFNFVPFEHNDFAYTKHMLDLAREQDVSTPSGALSKALILMNGIDYICKHLSDNISDMSFYMARQESNGIFANDHKKDGMQLGRMVGHLKCFLFPEKEEFLEDLQKFNDARKTIAHQLLTITSTELATIVVSLSTIDQTAEVLLERYDRITKAMKLAWDQYMKKTFSPPETSNPLEKIDSGKPSAAPPKKKPEH